MMSQTWYNCGPLTRESLDDQFSPSTMCDTPPFSDRKAGLGKDVCRLTQTLSLITHHEFPPPPLFSIPFHSQTPQLLQHQPLKPSQHRPVTHLHSPPPLHPQHPPNPRASWKRTRRVSRPPPTADQMTAAVVVAVTWPRPPPLARALTRGNTRGRTSLSTCLPRRCGLC